MDVGNPPEPEAVLYAAATGARSTTAVIVVAVKLVVVPETVTVTVRSNELILVRLAPADGNVKVNTLSPAVDVAVVLEPIVGAVKPEEEFTTAPVNVTPDGIPVNVSVI